MKQESGKNVKHETEQVSKQEVEGYSKPEAASNLEGNSQQLLPANTNISDLSNEEMSFLERDLQCYITDFETPGTSSDMIPEQYSANNSNLLICSTPLFDSNNNEDTEINNRY